VQYWGGYNASSYTCDTTFTEMYTYPSGGAPAPTGKQLVTTRTLNSGYGWFPYSVTLAATFSYDNEGRLTGESYPTDSSSTTANVSYTFDSMGRLNTMTDNVASVSMISGATYGPANELLSLSSSIPYYCGGFGGETRTYNSLKQVTNISSGTYVAPLSINYTYPTTGNNGKIDYQYDNFSGEQVNYTYDTVNRLITAATSSSDWGQSFTYDGFTNLTGVTVTKGTAPGLTSSGSSNDANGNPTSIYLPADGSSYTTSYDVENRMVSTGGLSLFYSYAPGNKRIWRGTWTGGSGSWTRGTDTITFYSVNGQKLGDYALTTTSGVYMTVPQFYTTETEVN
jgi:YD repeat-containing protein